VPEPVNGNVIPEVLDFFGRAPGLPYQPGDIRTQHGCRMVKREHRIMPALLKLSLTCYACLAAENCFVSGIRDEASDL